ncbi:phosphotransferase family protein [Streptomyces aureus]|uniref:phosphotransferase family protein n=1 Tax=Streptomyces aureus TaxID=193461 RepID=UPI0033F70956
MPMREWRRSTVLPSFLFDLRQRERTVMAPGTTSLAHERAVELSGDESLVEGPLQGYHHETYVVTLPAAGRGRWKCREPRPGLLWFDRRCFASEEQLIRALEGRIEGIPGLVPDLPERSDLQRFIEGSTLGTLYRSGSEIPFALFEQIVALFSQLVEVKVDSINVPRTCSPDDRPADGDTAGFMERLIVFTEREVYLRNMPDFEVLFHGLGLGGDPFGNLRERVSGLTARPFCLLHADLHRENFVVDAEGRLWTIDWELAMFGDPLYDLATHLYLMRYPADQERWMTKHWCEAVEKVAPGSSDGWETDLPRLLSYKRAQSVFADVIRTALSLEAEGRSSRERLLVAAGDRILKVLAAGAEPLGSKVPSLEKVTAALRGWLGVRGLASRHAAAFRAPTGA